MDTMGRILEHWRVLAAISLSFVLIAGAYKLAGVVEIPSIAQASEETTLLKAIATKDSDSDGLPDWEETLYGTDPHNTDSFALGTTDGDAVERGLIVPKAIANIKIATTTSETNVVFDPSLPAPPSDDTLTAAFARNFLTIYLAAKQMRGGDLTEDDIADVSNRAISLLVSSVSATPDFKSAKDITVSGSGADALVSFAIAAEAVMQKNTSYATTSEIVYLKNAVENGDETAIPHIESIAKAYRDSAAGIAVLPIPKELAASGLAIINSLMRVGEITSDFARVSADPLATMLAIGQYPQAVITLRDAFISVGSAYKDAGITLSAESPGASFVNLIEDIGNKKP